MKSMRKALKNILAVLLILAFLLSGCTPEDKVCAKHFDNDENGVCDKCYSSVFVYFDIYSLSDLYGSDTDTKKLCSYLENAQKNKKNFLLLSAGNMHGENGSTVSQLNGIHVSAMAPGLNELSEKKVNTSEEIPFIAINVYDKITHTRAEAFSPSVIIEKDGIKIGVIGAVADIELDSDSLYLKTGFELTALVKAESEKLRKEGALFIIYLLHGGYDADHTENVQTLTDKQISSYYEPSLSDGYVDIVFEGGTAHSYRLRDSRGVYHLQCSGEDSFGISHAEVAVNTASDTASVRFAELIETENYIPPADTSEPTETPDQSENGENSRPEQNECAKHSDKNNDGSCDLCSISVLVYLDFYGINDLHGKLADTDSQPGVDELTSYLKNARKNDDNAFFISAGDMWQGSSESNLTKGQILTDWMNELDFTCMALGNHEYDWGEEYIEQNYEIANFPFLAVNIYDKDTNKLAKYCRPSVMVQADGVDIGFIGAIGDCYSSIAADKREDVYFKVGSSLTELVKAESEKLRNAGADFIVYIIHDGYGNSSGNYDKSVTASQISSYYDISLSNGYVDLVFEGHTHQGYILKDEYGVYHLQNRGDNKGGISHAEVVLNTVTNRAEVDAELVSHSQYTGMSGDSSVEDLLEKYDDIISPANKVIGYNKSYKNSYYLCQLMADLYYDIGVEEWGDEYDIVLGGGYLSTRSPYNLSAGDVTYADVQALFPFDNQLLLCSIKGVYLKSRFFATGNDDYYICYDDYGNYVKQNLNPSATYYVIVDSYTAYYAPNHLTVVEEYAPDIFPRDLLAQHIKDGGLS